jgi:hypothetical protein
VSKLKFWQAPLAKKLLLQFGAATFFKGITKGIAKWFGR